MTYELHLEAFDGPFDLLIHLIEKNQVDIYDIPIAEITEQYLAYLQEMEEMNLEIASSFLVMAANLLAIKARMLVPVYRENEDGETEIVDEREELVADILEYMRFKEAARSLGEIASAEIKTYFRQNDSSIYASQFSDKNLFNDKTVNDLVSAFSRVLQKLADKPQVLNIVREEITINQKLNEIYLLAKDNPEGFRFEQLFEKECSRLGMVVSFLALLELIHSCVVKYRQNKDFDEIFIYPYKLANFHGV